MDPKKILKGKRVLIVDDDQDGVTDSVDNCPDVYNPDQENSDSGIAPVSYWRLDENDGPVCSS